MTSPEVQTVTPPTLVAELTYLVAHRSVECDWQTYCHNTAKHLRIDDFDRVTVPVCDTHRKRSGPKTEDYIKAARSLALYGLGAYA